MGVKQEVNDHMAGHRGTHHASELTHEEVTTLFRHRKSILIPQSSEKLVGFKDLGIMSNTLWMFALHSM